MERDAVAAGRDRSPSHDWQERPRFGYSAANDADAVVRRIPAHKGGAEVDQTGTVVDSSPADERGIPRHGRGVLDIGDPGDGVFLSWLITGETRK
jgi:hypothetical protein